MTDISTLHSFRCDLNQGPSRVRLSAPLMHQDALADIFRVAVSRAHVPLDLTGMTVRGNLFFSATRQMITLDGAVSGHYAAVTLTPECYQHPGYCTLAIQLQSGNARHTVLNASFTITPTGTVSGGEMTMDGNEVEY